MKPRTVVIILTAALAVYFVLLGRIGWMLMREGTLVAIGLGIGVLLLPIVGAVLIWFELRFGWRTQELGRELAQDGGLEDPEGVVVKPSGRIDRASAGAHFEKMKALTEAAPLDWRSWFRLADAYELAGDRKRAREAMRQAIDLHG